MQIKLPMLKTFCCGSLFLFSFVNKLSFSPVNNSLSVKEKYIFEKNINDCFCFSVERSTEPPRGETVSLHQLAGSRSSESPTSGSDLHPEVVGREPGRRRSSHRSLQRRGRPNGNLHHNRFDVAAGKAFAN